MNKTGTVSTLIDDLSEELRELFSGEVFKNKTSSGPISIFPYSLPFVKNPEERPCPYIVSRIVSGMDSGEKDSTHDVDTTIHICLYDDGLEAQGDRDVLHVIHKIYERFSENPDLKNKYIKSGDITWALAEENTHPYYYGALMISWSTPAIRTIRREDYLT